MIVSWNVAITMMQHANQCAFSDWASQRLAGLTMTFEASCFLAIQNGQEDQMWSRSTLPCRMPGASTKACQVSMSEFGSHQKEDDTTPASLRGAFAQQLNPLDAELVKLTLAQCFLIVFRAISGISESCRFGNILHHHIAATCCIAHHCTLRRSGHIGPTHAHGVQACQAMLLLPLPDSLPPLHHRAPILQYMLDAEDLCQLLKLLHTLLTGLQFGAGFSARWSWVFDRLPWLGAASTARPGEDDARSDHRCRSQYPPC